MPIVGLPAYIPTRSERDRIGHGLNEDRNDISISGFSGK